MIITYRGKPCATLIPYEELEKSVDLDKEEGLFGIWADRKDLNSVEDYLQNQRKSWFS